MLVVQGHSRRMEWQKASLLVSTNELIIQARVNTKASTRLFVSRASCCRYNYNSRLIGHSVCIAIGLVRIKMNNELYSITNKSSKHCPQP